MPQGVLTIPCQNNMGGLVLRVKGNSDRKGSQWPLAAVTRAICWYTPSSGIVGAFLLSNAYKYENTLKSKAAIRNMDRTLAEVLIIAQYGRLAWTLLTAVVTVHFNRDTVNGSRIYQNLPTNQ